MKIPRNLTLKRTCHVLRHDMFKIRRPIFTTTPLLFFATIILFSCQSTQTSGLEKYISSLITVESQKLFLEQIHDKDQNVRNENNGTSHSAGNRAQLDQEMIDVDISNLEKIELYLSIHGHPTIKEHGDKAARTPCLVVHHAIGGVEPRLRNFKYLYPAYINGNITDTSFTFYLNRTYQIKFGNRIKWDRPFRTEEELDTLYKALQLRSEIQRLSAPN